MAGAIFFKFIGGPPVMGEGVTETNKGSDGWIELTDWNWDVETQESSQTGGGSAVGTPTPNAFGFSKPYDLSSAPILQRMTAGTHFDAAQVQMRKQVSDSTTPQVYFEAYMGPVFITKTSIKGDEEGKVTMEVELHFKEITMAYRMQDNKGKLETGQTKVVAWNVAKKNQALDLLTKYKLSI